MATTGKNIKSRREKNGKSYFAPLKNFPVTPLCMMNPNMAIKFEFHFFFLLLLLLFCEKKKFEYFVLQSLLALRMARVSMVSEHFVGKYAQN